jgi:hypothetical protein
MDLCNATKWGLLQRERRGLKVVVIESSVFAFTPKVQWVTIMCGTLKISGLQGFKLWGGEPMHWAKGFPTMLQLATGWLQTELYIMTIGLQGSQQCYIMTIGLAGAHAVLHHDHRAWGFPTVLHHDHRASGFPNVLQCDQRLENVRYVL